MTWRSPGQSLRPRDSATGLGRSSGTRSEVTILMPVFGRRRKLCTWALKRCDEVEKTHGAALHKGIEYCNLAVSLLYQGRFDGAVLLLEAAEEEDHRHGQVSHAGINVIDRFILRQAFNMLFYASAPSSLAPRSRKPTCGRGSSTCGPEWKGVAR